jgi:hypothetical protein
MKQPGPRSVNRCFGRRPLSAAWAKRIEVTVWVAIAHD